MIVRILAFMLVIMAFAPFVSTAAYSQAARIQRVVVEEEIFDPVEAYLINVKGTTTLAATATAGVSSIVVTSATGAVVGEAVNISQNGNFYQTIVSSATGTTIGLATPMERTNTAGAVVQFGAWNMNVNGSVTPATYQISAPIGSEWHIESISVAMTDNSDMDFSTYGGITALTRPVYLYEDNAFDNNHFIVTNNAGYAEYGFTVSPAPKAPTGQYGINFFKDIHQVNGTAAVLDGDTADSFKFVINSDLTGLIKHVIVVHGHRSR